MPRTKPLGWGSPGPRPARPPPRSQDKSFNPSHAFLASMGTPSGEQPLPGGRGTPPPLPLRRPEPAAQAPATAAPDPHDSARPQRPSPNGCHPRDPNGGRAADRYTPAPVRPHDETSIPAPARGHHLPHSPSWPHAHCHFRLLRLLTSAPPQRVASDARRERQRARPAAERRGAGPLMQGRGLACRGGAAHAGAGPRLCPGDGGRWRVVRCSVVRGVGVSLPAPRPPCLRPGVLLVGCSHMPANPSCSGSTLTPSSNWSWLVGC